MVINPLHLLSGSNLNCPKVRHNVDIESALDLLIGTLKKRFSRHDASIVNQD